MLIKNWMTKEAVTAAPETPMLKASRLMKEKNIRCLPVVDGSGKLAGIVTDRDMKEYFPSAATSLDVFEMNYLLSKVKISEIMTKDTVTVKPDETIEFAAALMVDNKISSLPVLDDDRRVVGILTITDIFKTLITITGVYKGDVQFGFQLEDKPGSIREVTDFIRSKGGRIVSILSHYPDDGERESKEVYIRVKHLDTGKLKGLSKELGEKFTLLYTVEDFIGDIGKRRIKR